LLELLKQEDIRYHTMIALLVLTGCRRGELLGLQWEDIDWENKTIRIVRSSQYIGGGTYITKEPKTAAGKRVFTIPESAITLLKKYRVWQKEQRLLLGDIWENTDDRLFTSHTGGNLHPDTISKWFKKFVQKHNFPDVTIHNLRHTNASLLIAAGTDVVTVSKRLGHANPSITLNCYSHALPSNDIDAANKLDMMCGAV